MTYCTFRFSLDSSRNFVCGAGIWLELEFLFIVFEFTLVDGAVFYIKRIYSKDLLNLTAISNVTFQVKF